VPARTTISFAPSIFACPLFVFLGFLLLCSASPAPPFPPQFRAPDSRRSPSQSMVSAVVDVPAEDGGGAPAVQRLPPPAVGVRASSGAAHSASTSGGSSEQQAPDGADKGAAMAAPGLSASASTPASESTFLRLNTLDINGDDAPSSQAPTRFASPIFFLQLPVFTVCLLLGCCVKLLENGYILCNNDMKLLNAGPWSLFPRSTYGWEI
jgi:hypothetical protein